MSCWLMIYGGSGVVSDNGGGSSDWLSESADSLLDLLSDSYSNSNVFLCKG